MKSVRAVTEQQRAAGADVPEDVKMDPQRSLKVRMWTREGSNESRVTSEVLEGHDRKCARSDPKVPAE